MQTHPTKEPQRADHSELKLGTFKLELLNVLANAGFFSLCCGPHPTPILSPSCVSWDLGTERVALSSAPLVADTALLSCSLGLAGCGLGGEAPALALFV